MAYSTQRAVSDGTLVLLNLSLDYFDRSEITVLLAGIVSPAGSGKWAWVGTTNKQISFTPAVANGVEVTIKRSTQLAAPLNQYTKGAQFVAETLDDNFNQVLRIAQEAAEGSGAKDVYNDVDYHGFKLRNVGAAVDPTDVVTLAQYQADAAGAKVARDQAVTAAGNSIAARDNSYASQLAAESARGTAATSATNAATSATAAATSASNAATSEGNALASKNAAAASLTSFKNLYYGSLASAPTTRPDGSAMVVGDMYFDTSIPLMRVRQSSGWVNIASAVAGNAGQDFAAQNLNASAGVNTPALNGGPLAGFRNFIINGACAVTQRGQATIPNGGVTYGGADRIFAAGSGYNTFTGTVQRVGQQGGYMQEMRVSSTGAVTGANCYFGTRLEASDTAALNGKQITFSVQAYHDCPQAINCTLYIQRAGAVNDFSAPVLVASKMVSLAPGNRTPLSMTTTFGATDCLNGLQLCVIFQTDGLINSSPHYFQAGYWQLEVGPVATQLENRPTALELMLCQRYYETGLAHLLFTATGPNQYSAENPRFKVYKRIPPTVALNLTYSKSMNTPVVISTLNDGFKFYNTSTQADQTCEMDGVYTANSEL